MKCMYCDHNTINYEMFVVQKAVKPKGQPHRWVKLGNCCDNCEAAGKPIMIEYQENNDAQAS